MVTLSTITGHSKTPEQAALCRFHRSLNASAFCMASLCPSRLSACTHLSLNVIFAMHCPNSDNPNEFYPSDSHPYGIRARFMNEIDIFKNESCKTSVLILPCNPTLNLLEMKNSNIKKVF